MPGAIYGEGYRELGSHCFAYIHATEVGGTHPGVDRGDGPRRAQALYLDTPENAEVAGGAGIPFRHENLSEVLESVLAMRKPNATNGAPKRWSACARATVGMR